MRKMPRTGSKLISRQMWGLRRLRLLGRHRKSRRSVKVRWLIRKSRDRVRVAMSRLRRREGGDE